MSKREALRELQGRLAVRLQAAQSEGVAASWLAVEARGLRLLFPLSQSGEIFPWTEPQTVPYAQTWFLGVANLRGNLLGVADLASLLARLSPAAAEVVGRHSSLPRADMRLIAFNAVLEVNCTLLVDKLAGLRHTQDFVQSVAPPAGSSPCFGHGYTDAQGLFWQEINLQTLSQLPEFLTISA